MTEREKLIDLLQIWGNKENDGIKAESIADYLLENGVIVPPVKVGEIPLTLSYMTVLMMSGLYQRSLS